MISCTPWRDTCHALTNTRVRGPWRNTPRDHEQSFSDLIRAVQRRDLSRDVEFRDRIGDRSIVPLFYFASWTLSVLKLRTIRFSCEQGRRPDKISTTKRTPFSDLLSWIPLAHEHTNATQFINVSNSKCLSRGWELNASQVTLCNDVWNGIY